MGSRSDCSQEKDFEIVPMHAESRLLVVVHMSKVCWYDNCNESVHK